MAGFLKIIIFLTLSSNMALGTIPDETVTFNGNAVLAKPRHPRNLAKPDTTPHSSLFRPDATPDFTNNYQISPTVQATWAVYNKIGKIDFFVQAKTKGFVGFGFTDNGVKMDLIIGGLNPDGIPYFSDRNSVTGNVSNTRVDSRQDWQLYDVVETWDSTLLWFIRSLNTGDTNEDIIITDKPTNIVWVTGATDNVLGPSVNGLFRVNMLQPRHPKIDFKRVATLSPRLFLTWKVNFTTETVTFDLTGNATGYIGFGIGKTASMFTDFITGGVNGESLTPYFTDRYSVTSGCCTRQVASDARQDYHLLTAREENGVTHLKFIRSFNTGDLYDKVIRYENAYFIWALGKSDLIEEHTTDNRGAYAVNPLSAV